MKHSLNLRLFLAAAIAGSAFSCGREPPPEQARTTPIGAGKAVGGLGVGETRVVTRTGGGLVNEPDQGVAGELATSTGASADPDFSTSGAASADEAPPEGRPQQRQTHRERAEPAEFVSETPVPPAGAQYTIFCMRVAGPDHVERAREIRGHLVQKTGKGGWYVIHAEDQSTLYYGFYKSINDPEKPKENRRAEQDRNWVESIEGNNGERPFENSMLVQLAAPDPDAPPQWNLENVPPEAFWSLQIGAFTGYPDRKKDAVTAVREARAAGEQAYYYHGETTSSVCIGVWPREAVEFDEESARAPDPRNPINMGRPDEPIAVLPAQLAERHRNARDKHGKRINVYTPELRVRDETLLAKMQQFPHHAVNGVERYEKQRPDSPARVPNARPEPSRLVQVPRRTDSLLADDVALEGPSADEYGEYRGSGDAYADDPLGAANMLGAGGSDRSSSATPGSGKLRSIEDR